VLPNYQGKGRTLSDGNNPALAYLKGHTIGDVMHASAEGTAATLAHHHVPLRVLRTTQLNDEAMGELLMRHMAETVLAAALMGVNPYDQPAVEEGKKRTRSLLDASSFRPSGRGAMAQIRLLPESLVNQIAAGEVIERPASVVKELVENAIDAGARTITIALEAAGKNLIRVQDDGHGIARDDLTLAVTRHATSKLAEADLLAIHFLGFRGEALPAIGSVAKLTLTSRAHGADSAYQLSVEGGTLSEITPAAGSVGTTIEVRDLFYAVPARLKFLKSDRAEQMQVSELIERIAIAHPDIHFTLLVDGKISRQFTRTIETSDDSHAARIAQVVGRDFTENMAPVSART